MQYIIKKSWQNSAEVNLPASKSISNRALVIKALAGATTAVDNLSDCDDTRVMTNALTGCSPIVNIGAAGTAMRFLTAYFSVADGMRIITGTERMQQRPIRVLVDALRQLGADISYAEQDGFPPLLIKGRRLRGGELTLPGNVSSQYISALMMIAPTLPGGLLIRLEGDVTSWPYIALTMSMMQRFGIAASWTSAQTITIPQGTYKDVPFTVEGDWSAASYWFEMLALADDPSAEVLLRGLTIDSDQGDCKGAPLFARLGVDMEVVNGGVLLRKIPVSASRLDVSIKEIPDLAQTFVVTCCLLGVPFRFSGLHTLRIKETDRIQALITELGKLGYELSAEGDDALRWDGDRKETDMTRVTIATYKDHRMAMAFAPACLKLGSIRIDDPMVVTKSYPDYWNHLTSAGFEVEPVTE